MCQHRDHETGDHEARTPPLHDHDHAGHRHAGHRHGHRPPPGSRTPDELAECPAMPGSMAVKADAEAAGLVREHEGRTYWLCCAACGPLFDADPAKYATPA